MVAGGRQFEHKTWTFVIADVLSRDNVWRAMAQNDNRKATIIDKRHLRPRQLKNDKWRRHMTSLHYTKVQLVTAGKLKNIICYQIKLQEAQLPQRNSASAAHIEGAKPSSPLPSPSGYTYAYGRIRNPQQTYVKRTLSWIGHSRSFKVILICADRNPERCIVVISN